MKHFVWPLGMKCAMLNLPCHPSILSGSYASEPVRCPSCSTLPNPPQKPTNIYSKCRSTHIYPAVIHGHNPSYLPGVRCKVASVCMCAAYLKQTIFYHKKNKESNIVSGITAVQNKVEVNSKRSLCKITKQWPHN